MSIAPPADVRAHLTTSRQLLVDEHALLDHRAECLRLELDQSIERRAAIVSAIVDLDRFLDAHFASTPAGVIPPGFNQIGNAGPEYVIPLAKPAEPKVDGRAAAGKELATCADCGRTMSKLGLPRHRTACTAAPAQSAPAAAPASAAPAAEPAAKKTGRPRTVDYDEAARVIADGHAAGVLPLLALMKHYNKPPAFANNLIRSLRRVGLMPEGPSANIRVVEDVTDPDEPSPPDTPATVPPAAEVADTYREAIKANRRPIQTIVDRYDCTREQAQEWVDAARAAGELPPKGEPVLPASDAPVQFVPRG